MTPEDLGVTGDGERGPAFASDPLQRRSELGRRPSALRGDELDDGVTGTLAQHPGVEIDAAHPGLRGERNERRVQRAHVVLADPVLLGQHDDGAALRGLVGERGELRHLRQLGLRHPRHGDELRGQAVADRDRPGLVEQEHVDVAGRFDRASGERQHVAAHEAIHAGDADRRQQGADRRRDERHEQRDERRLGDRGAGEQAERPQGDDDDHEDQRQTGEEDPERDLVRRLAPRGALHQGDHAIEERLPRLLRDLDHDPVREHAGAAGDRTAIAA